MSEFSESYHLRTERAEDAIELLRRAQLKGYVFQPTSGWVTFVAEGGEFEPDPRIVAAANHPLLHYVSAEDHCRSFNLFNGANAVSGYHCGWDDDITFDDSMYSRDALEQFVPSVQPALLDELEQHLHPKEFDEVLDSEPSKLFAQALELEHYEWLSFDYIARDLQDSRAAHPEVTKVT